jgi:hypothetical protein
LRLYNTFWVWLGHYGPFEGITGARLGSLLDALHGGGIFLLSFLWRMSWSDIILLASSPKDG